MSRDFDDIIKHINSANKNLGQNDMDISKQIDALSKDNQDLIKDIKDIKKQIKDISFKVDTMLEILNNFTIMLAEDDEDIDSYGDQTWVPEDEDEDEESDDWNSHEDDS